MDALIITLREGIEAALVIGIILAYLTKTQKESLKKYAFAGLIGAVAFSIFGALIFKLSRISAENEIVEGIIFFTAAFFVTSMVIWMRRTGRFLKQKMETRIDNLAQKTSIFQGLSLFLFTFLMVGREGIETALLMMALSFQNASSIMTFSGAVLGLVLAVAFGYLFIKGSLKIDLHKFFNYTSLILIILTLKLVAGGIHEFTEVGILPTPRWVIAVVGFLVKDNISIAVLISLLAIPVIMVLLESRKNLTATLPTDVVEKRKKLAVQQKDRNYKIAASAVGFIAIFLLTSAFASAGQLQDPIPQSVNYSGAVLKLNKDKVLEGFSKYRLMLNDKKMQILVLKKGNLLNLAADACQVCGSYGYLMDQDTLICKNCNAPIPIESIGEKGGCNPVPLKHINGSKFLTISPQELDKAIKKIY